MRKWLLLGLIGVGWFVLPKPGHDYTPANRALHQLKTWNSLELNPRELNGQWTEAELRRRYPKIKWDCGPEAAQQLGDRSCYTMLRSFDLLPAWQIVFFFKEGELRNVKLDLPPESHRLMLSQMQREARKSYPVPPDRQGKPVVAWAMETGLLTTNSETYKDNTTQLLWSVKEIFSQVQWSTVNDAL